MTILILSALLPVLLVLLYINYSDKHEKEPKKLLIVSFVLGAVLSVVLALIMYFGFDIILPLKDDFSIQQQIIKAFLVVGFTEEFSKYIIVKYYAQPKKAFNEPFDGIVYAVMVSMGFAATENIIYVTQGGFEVAMLRAFTAIPAHATFGIIMGYYMGLAKFSSNRILYNFLGLFFAVLFHGLYDVFLFLDFIPGIAAGAFISLIVAIVLSRIAIKKHQFNSYFK
ncbi:PrsW family intramembrane metalloprotease [Aurantibacter aestuarii]|uniref:Protease PrsW n=1 Tax=Aurantibacter aestuarii TaxID=1266046 RepID=A0A2T1N892_9FLAO|nr:PrsW family glutamic-type intramembrane protease [Aurantibacter aestuarii]PSG88033.1 PrsW family intramembrane metalloprotease [Aurantibacter aestuarii]